MLTGATHVDDAGMLEHRRDFDGWRLKHLRLIGDPDGLDNIARDALVQAASNGFYLRKFRHWELV